MNKEELLWLRRYNRYCGKFMYKERCRRGISEQKYQEVSVPELSLGKWKMATYHGRK